MALTKILITQLEDTLIGEVMEQEVEKFLNILDEDRLKLNCNFASLYVLYYEYLKDTLVDLPKTFFNQMEIKDGENSVRESYTYKKTSSNLIGI